MKKYTVNRAFSLIELMVVIAIVAILSAVALPAYKTYVMKANVSSAVQHLGYWTDQAIAYYTKHGVFPNETELGVNNPASPDLLIPPYVPFVTSNNSSNNPTDCPNGTVNTYLVNYDGETTMPIGSGNTGGPYMPFGFIIVDVKGTFQKFCFYNEIDPVTSSNISRELVNGCTDLVAHPTYMDQVQDLIANGCQ